MKKLIFLLLFLPAALWAFQKTDTKPAKKNPGNDNMVTFVCRVYGLSSNMDSLNLYEQMGLSSRIVARAGRRPVDSAYVFTLPMTKARFYSVGAGEAATTKVILGEEKNLELWGNSQYMSKARTLNSTANKAFESLQKQITQLLTDGVMLRAQYNQATGTARKPAEERLAEHAKNKSHLLDSLQTANPLLWRFASLHLPPDYTGQGGSEIEFYGKEFFRNANLADKAYDDIADVFNAFENYTVQLLQLAASEEQLKTLSDAQLAKMPVASRSYRMAFGGIVSALKNASSPAYPAFANRYIEMYKTRSLGEVARLEFDLKKSSTFLTGIEAPDLAGMTPDSSTFSLKQLRGKVVMVDFWASWCGPCRKENPNVVASYNKYKEKGFDILGVSLDREIGAWRKAIKADGLPWHHISDLKGWQSSHAALYSVSSIPQTLLLDREGKIIARNLRGEQLGEKLKEIFGE